MIVNAQPLLSHDASREQHIENDARGTRTGTYVELVGLAAKWQNIVR